VEQNAGLVPAFLRWHYRRTNSGTKPMKQNESASRWIAIATWLLIAGCATQQSAPSLPPPTGDASWHIKEAEGTKHYTLAIGSVSSGAAATDRVTPIYPQGELASCPPPLEVEALLIVDKAGKVSEMRVANEAQADTHRRQFIAAVRTAALHWDFLPLKVDRWAADANGDSHVVDSETLPFSQTYVFRFACHAGKAAVSGGTVVAPHA
jgi:hypothetical protein